MDLYKKKYISAADKGLFNELKNQGVIMYHIVYDLLPIENKLFFPPNQDEIHEVWLNYICNSNGVFCISKTVKENFKNWSRSILSNKETFLIEDFFLSPEICESDSKDKITEKEKKILSDINLNNCFIMVGTIEPRKGHIEIINAFDILWRNKIERNLLIIGKEGWKELNEKERRNIPEIISKIKNHPKLNKNLFWIDHVTDECLEKIYSDSLCLIAASYNEGFGLPIIESIYKKTQVLARDIPIFREIGGNNISYFNSNSPNEIAESIKKWIKNYNNNLCPKIDNMNFYTWKDSADNILCKIKK